MFKSLHLRFLKSLILPSFIPKLQFLYDRENDCDLLVSYPNSLTLHDLEKTNITDLFPDLGDRVSMKTDLSDFFHASAHTKVERYMLKVRNDEEVSQNINFYQRLFLTCILQL